MIVLDEHLSPKRVYVPLSQKLAGRIEFIQNLRIGTTIKDEGIPELLLRQKNPTFTLNVVDFWLKFEPHPRFCIVCSPLPTQRQGELPELLLAFFKHQNFRTAAQRLGKIIRLAEIEIAYYEHAHGRVQRLGWTEP